MLKTGRVVLVMAAVAAAPAPAFAWGTAAHRFIMERAIDLLPAELKPFFAHFRDELVIRVVDPDTWRTAGWDDDPNHFVDFGVPEFGPPPFTALPREWGAAVEKFGMATLRRDGLLPWREQEEFGNLRRAFESFTKNVQYAPSNTVLFAAVAAHYLQDAHQPLHATNNHDGQLTGQFGVHARFESSLFERFRERLTISPPPVKPIANPRDASFDILIASNALVAAVLDADKSALGQKDTYDDEYFERFFATVKPVLEKQIAASISATAAVIVGAWQAAGKPPIKTEVRAAVQKVRPPK